MIELSVYLFAHTALNCPYMLSTYTSWGRCVYCQFKIEMLFALSSMPQQRVAVYLYKYSTYLQS